MAGSRLKYCSRCLTTFPADVERCPNLSCRAVRPLNGWGELLEPNDVLDRTYRVLKRLAIGGAGVTYLGRELGENQEETGPKVAIKLLYQQRDQGPYLRRLATEAQIIQGLNHPNIVEYRGFVHRTGHSPYLVTRYEPGGSLLDHVSRVGVLSVPIVAAIGKQVCDALIVAQAQGVIHRDLKPENVLLENPVGAEVVPRLRVADFGIAKVFGGVGERLTRVGAFVGTPQFAAPEQFEGVNPEPATDVYATGAMLYYCLMGRPVAGHMDEIEPEQQLPHLLAHLPPKLARPDLPPTQVEEMEHILAQAMTPQAGDRCSAADLGRMLATLAAPLSAPEVSGRQESLPVTARTVQTYTGQSEAIPRKDMPKREDLESEEAPVPTPSGEKTKERPKPDVRPTRTAGGESGGGGGGLGCGILALIGLAAALVVGAIGVGLYINQQGPVGRVITANDKDPVLAAEWKIIAADLGVRGVKAEATCSAKLGTKLQYLAVDAGIDGTGRLVDFKISNYDYEPARKCMADELVRQLFPRGKNKETVQVAVTLPK